jgi:hypothetical protein
LQEVNSEPKEKFVEERRRYQIKRETQRDLMEA